VEVAGSEAQGCKLTIDLIFCISSKVAQYIAKLGHVCSTDSRGFLVFFYFVVYFFCAK